MLQEAIDSPHSASRTLRGSLLVEAVGSALGQAAIVGKDEGRAVGPDQLEHAGDDRGPDARHAF